MYTIGQVSKMFDLPVSTLRYYDNQGFFPNLKRESGIRLFSEVEIESLQVIECLKKSGLEIKDIKRFMEWCAEGPSSYSARLRLIQEQKIRTEEEIRQMYKTLDMLKFKCWYYEQAIKDGSEENLKKMIPNGLPEEILKAYENSHKK